MTLKHSGKSKKWHILAAAIALTCSPLLAEAQRVALKTNALYWAAATPNIGAEFRINRHITFNYGAQNEAYMSRSAEKWVKGLCFNELGVSG